MIKFLSYLISLSVNGKNFTSANDRTRSLLPNHLSQMRYIGCYNSEETDRMVWADRFDLNRIGTVGDQLFETVVAEIHITNTSASEIAVIMPIFFVER